MEDIVRLSFSPEAKVDPITAALASLKPGEAGYMHDHSQFKTPFPVWIATRRKRLAKHLGLAVAVPLRYSRKTIDGDSLPNGFYRIFIDP